MATLGLIVFLFSHHIANTNLDRQRQTRERPISHSLSLWKEQTVVAGSNIHLVRLQGDMLH